MKNAGSPDTLLVFLNNMQLRCSYVERFINRDNTEIMVDIFNGKFVECYGQKAGKKCGAACRKSVFA